MSLQQPEKACERTRLQALPSFKMGARPYSLSQVAQSWA